MENLHWQSPFAVIYGKQPKFNELRAIGCLCFAHNVGKRNKFAPRATKSVLLGYTFGLKGYKLDDFENKKILHSRDVFQETIFPFKGLPVSHVKVENYPSYELLFPYHDLQYVTNSRTLLQSGHSPTFPYATQQVLDTSQTSESHDLCFNAFPHVSHALDSSPRDIYICRIASSASSPHEEPDHQAPQLRKSTRAKGPSTWLKHFVYVPSTSRQSTSNLQPIEPQSSHHTVLMLKLSQSHPILHLLLQF